MSFWLALDLVSDLVAVSGEVPGLGEEEGLARGAGSSGSSSSCSSGVTVLTVSTIQYVQVLEVGVQR